MNSVNEIDIKNRTYYFFGDMINTKKILITIKLR